jgi:hypothetical protein
MSRGRGGLLARVEGEDQPMPDLEASAQRQTPLLSPSTQDTQSTDLQGATVPVSQTPILDHSPKDEVEHVKSMPFGLEKPDMNPHQGLGRVFDPYHGGDDLYIYSKFLTQKSLVVVSFAHFDMEFFMTTGEILRNWTAYGSLYDHYNNNSITMVLHPDTQYPSIELLVNRKNGSTASCRIFANSLELLHNIPHVESYSGNDIQFDRLDLEKTRFTRDFYKRPNIGQIVVSLLSQGSSRICICIGMK